MRAVNDVAIFMRLIVEWPKAWRWALLALTLLLAACQPGEGGGGDPGGGAEPGGNGY